MVHSITVRLAAVTAAASTALFAIPAHSASFIADSTNIASVLQQARGGDLITLRGSFGGLKLHNLNFSKTVVISAWGATFSDTFELSNVQNLSIRGGSFGSATQPLLRNRAIAVYNSSNIGFAHSTVTGNGDGLGFFSRVATNLSVTDSRFSGLLLGIGFESVNGGTILNNRITKSISDGINIADSHFVTASGNQCSAGLPKPGAHPDCIQLWSIAGRAVQSDITVTGNTAHGPTQGFTSFNPDAGGGLRINISNNRVDSTFSQGVACYNCRDSVFTNNVLTTLPGAPYQTRINIVGGSNNTIGNNSVAAYVQPNEEPVDIDIGSNLYDTGDIDLDFGALAAPAALSRGTLFAETATAVPEPATWLQMILGFGLIGAMRRAKAASPATAPDRPAPGLRC